MEFIWLVIIVGIIPFMFWLLATPQAPAIEDDTELVGFQPEEIEEYQQAEMHYHYQPSYHVPEERLLLSRPEPVYYHDPDEQMRQSTEDARRTWNQFLWYVFKYDL